MNEFEKLNSTLISEANTILYDCGLLGILEKYGKPIVLGSYSLKLMTWRDLDIYLENDEIDIRAFFDLGYLTTMRQKLILFDVDGTLVSRDRVHDISFSVAFKKVIGIDANVVEIYGVNSGETVRSIVSEILEKKGFTEKEILSKIDDVFNEMVEYYKEKIEFDQSLKPIPHVMELLAELERRGCILGLVTGNLERIAKLKLKKVGLLDFFRIGGFGDSSTIRSELALEAIKKASEKLKIQFNKKDVFIVGDTPLDIECGKEIGVKTIAVSTGPFRIDELKRHDPDYLFNDFSDVSSILKAIDGV